VQLHSHGSAELPPALPAVQGFGARLHTLRMCPFEGNRSFKGLGEKLGIWDPSKIFPGTDQSALAPPPTSGKGVASTFLRAPSRAGLACNHAAVIALLSLNVITANQLTFDFITFARSFRDSLGIPVGFR
jgi:hypothetical protein